MQLELASTLPSANPRPRTVCGGTPCGADHLRFAQPRAMERGVSDSFAEHSALLQDLSLAMQSLLIVAAMSRMLVGK